MADESLEEFIRRGYDRINAEHEASLDFWHPDGEFVNSPLDPDHATYRGIDAIAEQHAGWFDAYPDLRVDPQEIRLNGNVAFVWTRFSGHARSTGLELELELAHIWTIEDGKIRRIEEHLDRDEGLRVAGLA
jgi:ketosteroid isomerase-like protein